MYAHYAYYSRPKPKDSSIFNGSSLRICGSLTYPCSVCLRHFTWNRTYRSTLRCELKLSETRYAVLGTLLVKTSSTLSLSRHCNVTMKYCSSLFASTRPAPLSCYGYDTSWGRLGMLPWRIDQLDISEDVRYLVEVIDAHISRAYSRQSLYTSIENKGHEHIFALRGCKGG